MRLICVISILCITALAGYCAADNAGKFTSGPGIGVMYADVGINVEYHANESFSVAGGINPFSDDFQWTAAGLYRPDVNNPLRFSLGITNSLAFFDDDDQRPTDPFVGIGWGPRKKDAYRGWNIDIIFGSDERSASLGYSF